MRIAIDISPIKQKDSLHGVRGSGEYVENLVNSLQNLNSKNEYTFFTKSEKLPENIDLIHIPYFDPFFFMLPISNLGKTVITIHDMIPFIFPEHFPSGIRGNIIWRSQKMILKKIRGIITDSNASKNDIAKFLQMDENHLQVVYLAAGGEYRVLKKSEKSMEVLKKYGLPSQFLLYVGDATWNKNLPRLVDAVKQTNLPLAMVGSVFKKEVSSNPWNKDLRKVLKETQNDKRFHFLGYVSTDDLVNLYNSATLFVFPSLYEGFGLPVLEAMSCGCPVLTSQKGSLGEIAGDSAYFIDPYSTNSIVQGIGKLFYDDKKRSEFSKKGIVQASKFSWENCAKKTIQVYEEARYRK